MTKRRVWRMVNPGRRRRHELRKQRWPGGYLTISVIRSAAGSAGRVERPAGSPPTAW